MAASQNQRLRRLADKSARRKAAVAEKQKAEKAVTSVASAAASPLRTCFAADGLFIDGMGWLVLARNLPTGEVGASFFLLDVWCLGVKDAFYRVLPPLTFEEHVSVYTTQKAHSEIDPSVARKLLHDVVAWSGALGLAPCEQYAKAAAIFGDIPRSDDTFTFGRDGKPMYISGPYDTPARIRQVAAALEKHASMDRDERPLPLIEAA